jgi:hypothetical protein
MSFLTGAIAPILLGGGTQTISNVLGLPQTLFNSITGTNNNNNNNNNNNQGQGQGPDSTMLIIAGVSIVALIILIKK